MQLLVINGPNLNLLGTREPAIYGTCTLEDISKALQEKLQPSGVACEFFQSNAEHEIIERIHDAKQDQTQFILINPAAFTHTSVAIRDALAAVEIPFIEVHLSNPHAREAFRRHSYFSDLALGVVSGFGPQSYYLAAEAATAFLKK